VDELLEKVALLEAALTEATSKLETVTKRVNDYDEGLGTVLQLHFASGKGTKGSRHKIVERVAVTDNILADPVPGQGVSQVRKASSTKIRNALKKINTGMSIAEQVAEFEEALAKADYGKTYAAIPIIDEHYKGSDQMGWFGLVEQVTMGCSSVFHLVNAMGVGQDQHASSPTHGFHRRCGHGASLGSQALWFP